MKTKIVVIILSQQGTLLGFKQQGKTRVDTSLGLGSAEGKKGGKRSKTAKKISERSEPIARRFFFFGLFPPLRNLVPR